MEKVGIENLTKIVKNAAECGNVVSRLINKAGLLALLGLQGPLSEMMLINWAKVKEEVLDLSSDERRQLETVLSETFKPVNSAVDAGLDKILELGEKSVSIAEKGVKEGQEIYETLKSLVSEWKAFLGV